MTNNRLNRESTNVSLRSAMLMSGSMVRAYRELLGSHMSP